MHIYYLGRDGGLNAKLEVLMRKIILNALVVVVTAVTSFVVATEECEKPIPNTWYKISTDALNPGELIAVDMSKGYSFAEGGMIYIVAVVGDDQFTIVFPNGAYWEAPKADAFLMGMQEEFDSLEDYLRNKSTEIKKK